MANLDVPDRPSDSGFSPTKDRRAGDRIDVLGPLIPAARTAAATWALFAGLALMMVGNGLQSSLVGIRSETEGFSSLAIGAVMTAYFLGIFVGTRAATRALTSVGHIRVFAALASMASAAALVYLVAVHPVSWTLMRFATGFCMAGLYVVAESWINDMATNANRGRLLAVYMVISMGGFAGGQFLLNVADPSGFELFVMASVLISLSLVPTSLSASTAPPSQVPEPMSLGALATIVPTGIVVALLVGMANGALIGMGAVYATQVGLSPAQVSLFMGAPMVGGVLGQFPVGAVSDRISRRIIIFALGLVATLAAIGLMMVDPGSPTSYGLMFTIGACTFPLYSMAIAYTNDWLRPEQMLGASAALVRVNAVGSMTGPFLATGLIAAFGPSQYFMSLAITHGAIAVFLVYRMVSQSGRPIPAPTNFLPFPGRATAVVITAALRRPRLPLRRNGGSSGV